MPAAIIRAGRPSASAIISSMIMRRWRSAWRASPRPCAKTSGCCRAIASPSSPSNVPEYIETLYAIWHAGCVAVPANAKLHGAELAYILEHSGARICFASSDLASVIDTHAPRNIERIVVFNARSYDALLAAEVTSVVPREGDDLAWLFYTSGTTGRPKGAMLTHSNLRAMSQGLYVGSGSHRLWRSTPACGADESRLRPLHGAVYRTLRRQCRAGIRRLLCRRNLQAARDLAAQLDVRGADDGEPDGRASRRLPSGEYPNHRLGRRADVCGRHHPRAGPLRPALCANLRSGRKPDDDHAAVAQRHRLYARHAMARTSRLCRARLQEHGGHRHRRGRHHPCRPAKPEKSSAAANR